MTGRIGPTPTPPPSHLSVPTQPQSPLKTAMPKTVESEPKIERSRSMTTVSESQMVESQVSKTSSKSMSVTKEVLGTKISLSDLSGELTAQQKLKGAFKDLKSMFTISSDKLEYRDVAGQPGVKRLKSSVKDLFLMKYNPLASSKDREKSSLFDIFAYKEFSNENVDFLKFSRKLIKMGTDHPSFDKHIGTAMEHFVRAGSAQEINIAYEDRKLLTEAYEAYKADPSTENKAQLVKLYSVAVKEVYSVMGDTIGRFDASKLKANLSETKQGRLWNNFKTAHKTWWNNRRPWNSMNDVKQDFGNFFKSWGAFSKATANVFFMQLMPEDSISTKTDDIGGKRIITKGSTSEVAKDKLAMMKYRAFRDGVTAPKYRDYGFE